LWGVEARVADYGLRGQTRNDNRGVEGAILANANKNVMDCVEEDKDSLAFEGIGLVVSSHPQER
jgi:hypothetical protein